MRGPFFHGEGGVLSADIAVPEHERVLAYYAAVLTTGSAPLWRDDLMTREGVPVIGLGERSAEYEMLPLQWMPHFQVADIATSVSRALELGGTELLHGKDENGRSQWAVLADADGAAFGLIPVVAAEPGGEAWPGDDGRIEWLSLVAPDVRRACQFYAHVIGWSADSSGSAAVSEMRRPDGVAVADICPVEHHEHPVPSVWLITLPVGDLDESLRRVHEHGGELVSRAGARDAIVRDPVGACIALRGSD